MSFRKMRRFKQELGKEEAIAILKEASHGTLALLSDDGYPYSIPLSYAFDESECAIYFHSAIEGHKIDAIRYSDKASFSVVTEDNVIPEKFTTAYKSVIAFGKISIIEDEKKKLEALHKLSERYCFSVSKDAKAKEIESGFDHLVMIEFKIEHLSAKCGSTLISN